MTRRLLVLGLNWPECPLEVAASMRAILKEHFPDRVTYAKDPREAWDFLPNMGGAILAYGPGVFGLATTRQPVRIETDSPSVIITDTVDIEPLLGTDDPRQFVEGARLVLRSDVHLITNPIAIAHIAELLNEPYL